MKIDEGAMSLKPVPCALSADVGGELPLIPEQFRVSGFPGELRCVRGRGQSSLRCWPENDLQFHGSEFKGQLHGRRRRGARTISSSRCSSSAQGGRFLRVLHAFWVLLRRVQVVILLSHTVLSRATLPSRYVRTLHRHVSSASVLLCMVMTVHATHIIHRIHRGVWCLEFREFGGRWDCTRMGCLRTWGNKDIEYEYSVCG